MKWRGRRASSNVSDRRGRGGVGLAGGGLGFIVVAVIVALLGGDPSYFLSEGISRTVQSSQQFSQNIPQAEQDEMVDFVSVVLAETEDTWHQKFEQAGMTYRAPVLVLYNGVVQSDCGRGQAAMGPFYCPLDETVYLDLNFFHDLRTRHNAPGDFAQAYVIAHEVGHHVQNITGLLKRTQRISAQLPESQANAISVKTELMADCLAGVWAHSVEGRNLLDSGDFDEAINAASQIGDDILQEQARGYSVPDSFTHGSSDERRTWFDKGFQTGDPEICDSFRSASN